MGLVSPVPGNCKQAEGGKHRSLFLSEGAASACNSALFRHSDNSTGYCFLPSVGTTTAFIDLLIFNI